MPNEDFRTGVPNVRKELSDTETLEIRMTELCAEIGFCLNLDTILNQALTEHETLEAAISANDARLEDITLKAEEINKILYPSEPSKKLNVIGYGDMEATGTAIRMAMKERDLVKNLASKIDDEARTVQGPGAGLVNSDGEPLN